MEKPKVSKDVEYFTNLLVGDNNEEEEFSRKMTLDLHQVLIVMMFRFMQRNIIDACREEKDEGKERQVRALPRNIIDGWKKKVFDQVDAELKEFNKQKDESDIGNFINAMMSDIEKRMEEYKMKATKIADAYIDALTFDKEKKEDGTTEEKG